MEFPHRVARERSRLLPPAVLFEKVHAAVAIDIAEAEAVGEFVPVALGRNGMKCPWLVGMVPIGGGVAEIAVGVANDLRFAVAVDVAKGRRLVVHGFEDDVALPGAFSTFGIFKPGSVGAREAVDQ